MKNNASDGTITMRSKVLQIFDQKYCHLSNREACIYSIAVGRGYINFFTDCFNLVMRFRFVYSANTARTLKCIPDKNSSFGGGSRITDITL